MQAREPQEKPIMSREKEQLQRLTFETDEAIDALYPSKRRIRQTVAAEREWREKMAARLEAEVAWLRRRALIAGSFRSDARRDFGISSNALVEFALGGPQPTKEQQPRDAADLASCFRAWRGAPAHLQPKMEPVLARFAAYVEARYPGAVEAVEQQIRKEEEADAA